MNIDELSLLGLLVLYGAASVFIDALTPSYWAIIG